MQCQRMNRDSNKIEVLTQDTVRLRNEKGQEILKYQALEISKKEMKQMFQDSIDKISKDTKIVTKIRTITQREYVTNTVTTYDTIKETDTTYISPIYSGYVGDKFFRSYVTARKDSIKVSPSFESILYLKFEQEDSWIFKKPLEVSIQNQNPYSTTESKTFTQKSKNPKLSKIGKLLIFTAGFLLGSNI
jgi:hypothetical protein